MIWFKLLGHNWSFKVISGLNIRKTVTGWDILTADQREILPTSLVFATESISGGIDEVFYATFSPYLQSLNFCILQRLHMQSSSPIDLFAYELCVNFIQSIYMLKVFQKFWKN